MESSFCSKPKHPKLAIIAYLTIAVDKCLISVFLSVSKSDLARVRINLRNILSIGSGPRFNLSGDGSTFKLEILNMSVRAAEIAFGENELVGLSDESHLIVDFIVLKELDDSGSIEVTFTRFSVKSFERTYQQQLNRNQ